MKLKIAFILSLFLLVIDNTAVTSVDMPTKASVAFEAQYDASDRFEFDEGSDLALVSNILEVPIATWKAHVFPSTFLSYLHRDYAHPTRAPPFLSLSLV